MTDQATSRNFAGFEPPITTPSNGHRVNFRFIDWIWNVRGSVPLEPLQSSDEAFNRLDPLFREYGTSHERTGDTLTFSKKDQPAQDKMSVFDAGVLKIEQGVAGAALHYRLSSRALLFCFCLPLLFLFFAQATIAIGEYRKPAMEAAEKAKAAKKKEPVVRELHPLDTFLGAPAPEAPKKDGAAKREDKQHSPKSAYVFAAMFAALYVIGRILEQWLVQRLFRKALQGG